MTDIIRIPNIDNYIMTVINGELVLTLIRKYLKKEELFRIDLTKSKILFCTIKDYNDKIISTSNSYMSILIDIYKYLPHQYILQNTTFNIKLTNEYGDYVYYPEINMSIQHKNANETIKEIINMIVMNTYSLDIRFKLETGEIVNYQQ